MKKIFFILLFMISVFARGQGNDFKPHFRLGFYNGQLVRFAAPIPGYTNIFSRYKYLAIAVDSGIHVAQYNGVPSGIRIGVWSADGEIAMDTTTGYFYGRQNGVWIKMAKFSDIGGSTPTWQQVLTAGSTLTGNNAVSGGGFDFTHSNIGAYLISGTTASVIGTTSTYFGQSNIGLTTNSTSLFLTYAYPALNNYIKLNTDSLVFANSNSFFKFRSLTNLSTQNALTGITTSTGQIGYVNPLNGLTIGSGNLKLGGTLVDATTTLDGGGTKNFHFNGIKGFEIASYGDGNYIYMQTPGIFDGVSIKFARVDQDSSRWTSTIGYNVQETKIDQRIDDIYITSNSGNIEISGVNTLLQESGGNVGIGVGVPLKVLHTVGTVRHASLGTASSDTTTNKPVGINSSGDIIPMTYWPGSGGGSGITVGTTTITSGTNTRIPFNNSGVYGESANLTWDGNTLYANAGATQGTLFQTANNVKNYMMASDATPSSGENYIASFYTGNYTVLEASHPGGGNFNIQNVSGALYLTSASSNSVILYPASTEVLNASSTGIVISKSLKLTQGADVASTAGAMSLGTDGNSFEITGTNSITLISNVGWQNGATVTLIFTSTATLVNGTSTSGTNITMKLAGAANFVATADDTITLLLSEVGGVQAWREVGRSIN